MRLHLPVRLFRAVIALMTVIPAFTQAFEIPSTYTTIFVTTTGDVTGKRYTSTDIAFLLQNDLTFSGLAVMNTDAGERFFASADPSELSSLTFTSNSNLYVDSDEKLTLAGLNTVTFQSGVAERYDSSSNVRHKGYLGGAIFAQGTGSITLQDNVSVNFTTNNSSSSSYSSYGGAIYSYSGAISLSGNDSVSFSGNYSSSTTAATYAYNTYGGAIYSYSGAISLSGNDSVTFSGNYSSSSSSSTTTAFSYGGAIYSNSGAISLSGNGSVTFSGNYSSSATTAASYYYSYGGAIYSSSGAISLSGNDSVTFSGNYSSSSSAADHSYSYGGAICSGSGAITLSENGHVEFIGNSARSAKSSNGAYGGAIYSDGQVNIRDNDSVIFAKNYERHSASDSSYTYRLRSLHVNSDVTLSAAGGNSIEFQDSMHVGGKLDLNSQYTNSEGKTVAQTGDIIFTGAYTAEHLGALKEDYTYAEYKNSLISDVSGLTTLYDGRLIIRDGAILGGAGLTVAASASGISTPTVLLQNAKLNQVGAAISFAEGTRFEVSGQSVVSASSLTLGSGCQLTLHAMGDNMATPVLILYGTLNIGDSLTLNISFNDDEAEAGSYKLMSVTSFTGADNWTADKITVNGLDGFELSFDALYWEGNELWLNFDGEAGVGQAPPLTEATWSDMSGTHEWDTSDKNWKQDKYQYAYEDGVAVVFGDTAAGGVTLVGELSPDRVLVNNSEGHDYTWVADPTIGGSLTGHMSLTKQGEGTLSIYTDNSFMGDTIIEAGRLVVGSADALGTGTVRLLGGTLEIAANAFDNTITAAGTAEILVQQGSILKLGRKIYNTEGVLTLNGIIDVSALQSSTIEATMVDVNGELGDSGFTRGAATGVQLVQGGTVEATGATVLYNGEVMTVDRTGFASTAPTIDYSVYSINGRHAVNASEISSVAGSALSRIDLNSGTLTADAAISNLKATGGTLLMSHQVPVNGTVQDTMIYASAGQLNATLSGGTAVQVSGAVTISGNNTHTGGTILNNGTLTITNSRALGTGSIISLGTGSIKANVALTLNQAIINTGTLTLSGSWNLSALALNTQAATHVDVDGHTGDSGFSKTALYEVQVVQGGTAKASNLTLTHSKLASGLQLTLGSDGVAAVGGVVDYSTYYLTGRDSVSVSEAESASGGLLNNVVMSGGNLTADASTKLTATGGSITVTDDATLSGTITNTDITFDRGNYSANISATIKGDGCLTINGGDVTLSGNNSYTGGTIINGGSLTATNAAVLGSGSVTVNSGTLDLNNQKVNNDISLNNGTLTGNDNYNGNLSIGGDNVAVEGGYTLGAGKVLEIAPGGTEFSTDLTLSGGTLLFRGAPLTVDGEVSFAAGTTTLVDLRSWEGQLTNGLTLAVLGSDVTGWKDGCLELIGMSNMELLFDDSTGSLTLQIAGTAPVAETITWLGAKKAVWQTGRAGWMNATTGYDAVFDKGSDVIFTQPGTVTIAGAVEPGSVIVAGDKSITFKSDKLNPGRIVGDTSLTKRGNGKLTLNDGNTYSGGTFIEAGTVAAGGATSFGRGVITISGGTLNLKGKAVANDITLTGAATIKGGKLYGGSFTMNGDLLKGSLLNIGAGETATLAGGTVNGTLSGTGTVAVTGDVTIGTSAKVTTNELAVSGALTVSRKGLAMNTKASAITVTSGGQLISEGALKAAALIVDGGQLELHSSKASSIAITHNTYLANGAAITAFANVKTANLTMKSGSQLTLGTPRSNTWAFSPSGGGSSSASSLAALSLKVSGNMNLTSSALTLSGKISAGNLSITNSYVNMTSGKLQTIAVKNTLTLSGENRLIFDFDAANGKSYKLFTYKGFTSDGTELHKLFGWDDNGSYTLTADAKAITLTVLNATAWEAYMDKLMNSGATATLSMDDALVESAGTEKEPEQIVVTAAGIDPRLGKVADTLVQSTWGTAGASRAFGDTIAARGTHATEFANGKGAAWISTMGGSSRISSDGSHAGADYTLTGAAFGMEARLNEQSTVGLAIGNSWGKVSTFSAFPVDADSTHQGIYGKHILGSSTTLSWMAAHTRTESDAKLAGMPCDWTQDALQLDARVDKLFAISDRTTVSAFVGMQYLATDKGECNGLSTGSLQNLRGEIGVSASHKATDRTFVYGELSFIGDMVRHNPTATVGDYRSRGANPGRAGLNLSVGASYQLNDSWSLNGSYNLELMQNQTSHSANVGATYSF